MKKEGNKLQIIVISHMENVGLLSKAVYLLFENTKIDAVASPQLLSNKEEGFVKYTCNSILDCFRHFTFLQWTAWYVALNIFNVCGT